MEVVGPCMLSVSLPPGHAPFSPSDDITPRVLFTMVGNVEAIDALGFMAPTLNAIKHEGLAMSLCPLCLVV